MSKCQELGCQGVTPCLDGGQVMKRHRDPQDYCTAQMARLVRVGRSEIIRSYNIKIIDYSEKIMPFISSKSMAVTLSLIYLCINRRRKKSGQLGTKQSPTSVLSLLNICIVRIGTRVWSEIFLCLYLRGSEGKMQLVKV